MPCSTDHYDQDDSRLELDRVTRLLCATCKQLESRELGTIIDVVEGGELREWWIEHQAVDAKREAIERAVAAKVALRKTALSKLTNEEKAALNLE